MKIDTFLEDPNTLNEAEQYRRRKTTSVLAIVFTDIADSTYLREQLGEIEYERLREKYDEDFSDIVESEDAGAVVKSTGDGALVVFSEPSTAVERCLSVQRQLGSHPHFKLRIGIDMGQVSVKSANGIVKDVFGRHVNRAARIEALAEPGHILTSFHIFDCAVGWLRGGNISWYNHGETNLKGFEGPISIHELFDPLYSSPQSNKDFPVYQPGLFSQISSAPPVILNSSDWDELYKDLGNNQLTVYPPTSISSDAPFPYYTLRIRNIVEKLNGLLPDACSILWVDDFPDNNLRERRVLEDAGCIVDLAISTEEAQGRLVDKRYFLVITDMKRGSNSTAGMDLLQWLQDQGIVTPSIVYASNWAAATYENQAKDAGSVMITAGVISLLDGVRQIFSGYYGRIPRELIEQQEPDKETQNTDVTSKSKFGAFFRRLCRYFYS